MSEYISREEFEKRIKPYDTEDHTDKALYNFAHNNMICCPSADVRPNIHGHWEDGNNICPKCGEDKFKGLDADIYADWQPNFCPNCGADMRGKAE